MTDYEWHSLYCSDCGEAIAFTPTPLPLQFHPLISNCPMYCRSCAHSHAEVAGYLMPVASGYTVNGLHEVDKVGKTDLLKRQFNAAWRPLCKWIQNYKVVKVRRKTNGT